MTTDPPKKPPHQPDAIATMHGIDKVTAALAFTAYADFRAAQGRALRDDGIREMKADGIPMPEIARRTGVTLGTVKAVCRMAPARVDAGE